MTIKGSPVVTAVVVWLQRFAGVTSRVGQVWAREGMGKDTILVIGQPQLVEAWDGSLSNVVAAACRVGWWHEVFSLDTNRRYFLNETWFSNSELGKSCLYERVV